MSKTDTFATDNTLTFRNSQGVESQGTIMTLSRHAVVFEVYNPYSIVQLSEVLSQIRIHRGDRSIYSGRAVVTNLVNTGLMLIVSASLVDPWSDMEGLSPGPRLRDEVLNFVDDWNVGNQRLRPGYQRSVSNLRNFLQEFSRWLEHGEAEAGITEPTTPQDVVMNFVVDVEAAVSPKVAELFQIFEEEARQVSEEDLPIHKSFMRHEVHPLIMCSPFLHRTFTKPLGYAGDYEMVNMIMREPLEGRNTYAKIVNAMHLRTGVAQAHRNRIDRLIEYLTREGRRVGAMGRGLRVLNIGCGPAAEVQRFIRTNDLADRLQIELLDFNEETLKYAESQVMSAIWENRRRTGITITHRSVHDLLKQAAAKQLDVQPVYDVVYSAGLFDYLSDRICQRLLRLFYAWVVPGGMVLVTNVHADNPIRGIMEHMQEWQLLLRNQKQMAELAPELGSQTVSLEGTGLNVFLEMRKPEFERTAP
jgi:extracellular factor (EF) 3-hydroxypalmitic acid methyl ester biosynthesis protein